MTIGLLTRRIKNKDKSFYKKNKNELNNIIREEVKEILNGFIKKILKEKDIKDIKIGKRKLKVFFTKKYSKEYYKTEKEFINNRIKEILKK